MEQKQSARDDNESGRFETDGQIHFHSATNWPYEKNQLGFLSWCFSPVNHPSGKCIGGALACAKGTLCGGAKGIPRYAGNTLCRYASICIPIWIKFREIQLPYSNPDRWYCASGSLHEFLMSPLLEFEDLGLHYRCATKKLENSGSSPCSFCFLWEPSIRLLHQQAFFNKQILVVGSDLLWLQTQESGTPSSVMTRTTRVARLNNVMLGGRDDFGWSPVASEAS